MNTIYTNNRIKHLFFLLLIFTTLHSVAQSDDSKFMPNITPPSPVAGELGKYGNVPVGMFTGTANISVPLISFKTKDLESPMSLFYGSNGIKVDEVASNVGLGWNLNFGGVITRTVRDKNDDTQTMIYPPDDMPNATNAERVAFYRAAGQGNADTEKDLYSFNFNGNSGKFVYDKNNIPVLINNQKIKIERINNNNSDFLLTTTNGVKYYFTDKETTSFRSQGEGHSVINASVTAWYLSKIVHPNGSEIYLIYDGANMDYTASNSQTLTMSYPRTQNSCEGSSPYSSAPTLSGIVSYNMKVIGKRVNKISSNNSSDGYVTFAYTASGINEEVNGNSKIETIIQYNADGLVIEKINFNYLKTANERIFLQNITFNDPSKKYSFEYINQAGFPRRLSTSQDHWGYYNGKENTNLVPKNIKDFGIGLDNIEYNGADKEPDGNLAKIGLLNKIIYPTKGYTEFDYESNTYWGEKTTYPKKTTLTLEKDETETNHEAKTINITSPIDQKIKLMGRVVYVSEQEPRYDQYGNLIPDPGNTGHYSAAMQITCIDPSEDCPRFYEETDHGDFTHDDGFVFITASNGDHHVVDNQFYFNAKAGKTYTLHLSKDGIKASARADISYYATTSVTTNTNIETGGVRIKATKDFAEPLAKANYKRYYYANMNDINHSSGDKGRTPFYADISTQRTRCPISDGQMGVACAFVNNSNLTISSSSLISLFDTGSSNCFYKYVTVSEGGDAFENGGEMKEFIVHRDYFSNPILGSELKSAPLTNTGWDNGLERKSKVLKKKVAGAPFIVVAENENMYKLDPSYNKEIKGYTVRKDFEELCADVTSVDNLSIAEYKTIAYWFYMESSLSIKYDPMGGNPITTVTNYVYNNPVHLQLTSQSTKSSLKENLETKYYYPQDLSTEPFVSEMITTNRIDTPLKTEIFRSGIKQSEQKTEYAKDATTGNLLLPKFIYAAKFPNSLSTANSLEKKITYDKYDDVGNILQYTLEDGTPVAIIWGYNKTKPIAKVENATYDQASAAYATNENTFRNNLPNAMITTYTYKPLIGVSTVTDPKGLTTYYEYDEFNRLKVVKDSQGNILSENQYHYKN